MKPPSFFGVLEIFFVLVTLSLVNMFDSVFARHCLSAIEAYGTGLGRCLKRIIREVWL